LDAASILQAIATEWPKFRRSLPWREVRDPWLALVSEILLIQTDAAKVSAAYSRIVKAIPSPADAMRLGEDALAELLRPLGLHRQKARALLRAATYIVNELGGATPTDYEELRKIPGVGEYAAAAVAIVISGRDAPVLDVNIARVLSRAIYGKDPPRRYMYDHSLRRLSEEVNWNRESLFAILDFAAEICRAKDPKCHQCPIASSCLYGRARSRPSPELASSVMGSAH
jgi:A/G-specific adenine glycosylase